MPSSALAAEVPGSLIALRNVIETKSKTSADWFHKSFVSDPSSETVNLLTNFYIFSTLDPLECLPIWTIICQNVCCLDCLISIRTSRNRCRQFHHGLNLEYLLKLDSKRLKFYVSELFSLLDFLLDFEYYSPLLQMLPLPCDLQLGEAINSLWGKSGFIC